MSQVLLGIFPCGLFLSYYSVSTNKNKNKLFLNRRAVQTLSHSLKLIVSHTTTCLSAQTNQPFSKLNSTGAHTLIEISKTIFRF